MANFEQIGSPARDPGEERVDREGQRRHRRALCAAEHDFMGDIIVHLMQIDLEAPHLATLERHGNVRRLHEAEPHLDAVDAVTEVLDRMPLSNRDPRRRSATKVIRINVSYRTRLCLTWCSSTG